MSLINRAISNMYIDKDQINKSSNESVTNSQKEYQTFGSINRPEVTPDS